MLWTKLDTATSRGCRVPGAPPQGPGIADMHQGFSEKTKPISDCHVFSRLQIRTNALNTNENRVSGHSNFGPN